jgi:tetratricopeptide (TPR) repeat protein
VRRQAGGYVLETDADRIDLHRFRDWVATSRELPDGPAADLLNSALSLWRDKAFADMTSTSPWLHNLADTLEQERIAALLRRNDLALARGDHAELLPELHELCAAYPLDERLAAQHMLALYRCGRQADALAAYSTARSVLAAELGLDPSQDLIDLRQRILNSDPVLTLQSPAPPPPAQPQPRWLAPQQLPTGTIDFTGRDAELSELDATMHGEAFRLAGAVPVITIDGTPGVGKTALAVQFGRRIATHYPDGQLFARLRAHQLAPPMTPMDVLTQFLKALGVAPERIPLDVDEAAALYRTLLANRRVLVVLDDASGPDQVRPLLPGNPDCAVLVTSRNRLSALVAKDGARRLTLDLLSEQAALALLGRIVGADRVAAEPAAATQLVRTCVRLPLALRIAAANLAADDDTSIAGYVTRLLHGDRLGALEVEGDREAAVRTAFDLSYRALRPNARLLFRRLGLLPGPDFTADIAAVPAGFAVTETEGLLRTLTTAHLVETVSNGRYRCHDLLRIFAVERLADDDGADREASRQRLHEYYLHAVDSVARLAYPHMLRLPADPPARPPQAVEFADVNAALTWLDVELPGVMALVAQTAEHGPRRVAWTLAHSLRGYFLLRRNATDWRAVATTALHAAEADDDPHGITAAELSIADLHWTVGSHAEATDGYLRAVDLAKRMDWPAAEATGLGNLGSVQVERGELGLAGEHYQEALDRYRSLGNQGAQAVMLSNLGNVHWELGSLATAAEYFSAALALHDELGALAARANTLLNLGSVQHDLGRFGEAIDNLRAATDLSRQVGGRADEATALEHLADVHCDVGRYTEALELAGAALDLAVDIGARRIEAMAMNAIGSIRCRLGEPAIAVEHHQMALELAVTMDDRRSETEALIGLATAMLDLGEVGAAARYAQRALTAAGRLGYRLLTARSLLALGAVMLRDGRTEIATDHTSAALDIFHTAGAALGEGRARSQLGSCLAAAGDEAGARDERRKALELLSGIGAPEADAIHR